MWENYAGEFQLVGSYPSTGLKVYTKGIDAITFELYPFKINSNPEIRFRYYRPEETRAKLTYHWSVVSDSYQISTFTYYLCSCFKILNSYDGYRAYSYSTPDIPTMPTISSSEGVVHMEDTGSGGIINNPYIDIIINMEKRNPTSYTTGNEKVLLTLEHVKVLDKKIKFPETLSL